MKGQVLKILFKENMAFLTQEIALNFTHVQLPNSSVKFKTPAFWTVQVINYIENEKRLHVEVLDYQVGETEFSYDQLQLSDTLSEVEIVSFKSIDTSGWLATSSRTQPTKILHPKAETVYRRETPIPPEAKRERGPVKQTYTEPFSISIKNVTFLDGKVTFEKKIQQFKKPIEFQIVNEDILKQYDAIKNYFENVLKTNKIQVNPIIEATDGVVTSVNATSAEIARINKSFIEEVKFESVTVVRKKELLNDKQLFTIEEFLDNLSDEKTKAQELFEDDDDFFETLLKRSGSQHYDHLRFLSSRHKYELEKLRIVHKPFSFIFLLSDTHNFYIVWETYDTHEATYIWTFANEAKDLKRIFTQIDKTISLIQREGKMEYIGRKEENFIRVLHDYSDVQNGFKNWKENIEKIVF